MDVNATTQPGFRTLQRPLIELTPATNFLGSDGFLINTDGNTLQGFVINRFPGNGIAVNGSHNTIRTNYIGTDVLGQVDRGNDLNGIRIDVSARLNVIGGSSLIERNVISGNKANTGTARGGGVLVFGSNNLIVGNYIGTNAAGDAAIGRDSLSPPTRPTTPMGSRSTAAPATRLPTT